MPESDMRELITMVYKKTLAIALKGASEELRAHIFKTMSSRAVEMLKEDSEMIRAGAGQGCCQGAERNDCNRPKTSKPKAGWRFAAREKMNMSTNAECSIPVTTLQYREISAGGLRDGNPLPDRIAE